MNSSQSSPRLSRAQSGAALTILAVALGFLPLFNGVTWFWSIFLIGVSVLLLSERLSDSTRGTLQPMLAVAVTAQAFHGWYLGLGWLPWLGASALLLMAEWHRLDWSRLRSGYRLYVPLGVAICLLALLATWNETAGISHFGWRGGMQYQPIYNYSTGYYSGGLVYNPVMYANNYSWPGFTYSGRALGGAIWIEIGLLSLVSWTAWRDDNARWSSRVVPLFVLAFIALWALRSANTSFGAPLWFLVGLAVAGFGVWKTTQNRNTGAFDPNDVAQRVQARISKSDQSS